MKKQIFHILRGFEDFEPVRSLVAKSTYYTIVGILPCYPPEWRRPAPAGGNAARIRISDKVKSVNSDVT